MHSAQRSIKHPQTSAINQSTHGPHSLKWVNHFSQDFLNICSALQFHIHLNHEKCFQSVIYETREQKLFDNDRPQVHEPVPLFSSNSSHGYSGFALWQESTLVSRNSHSSSFTRTQVVLSGFGEVEGCCSFEFMSLWWAERLWRGVNIEVLRMPSVVPLQGLWRA